MVLRKLVGQSKSGFKTVFLQEGVQEFFAFTLHLAVVAAQNGLNLGLGLGCGYEVDPRRTHVLRLGC